MDGFFSRAKKAVVAFVTTFVASVLTAMQNGTVWAPGHGLIPNWATVFTALGLALAAAAAVFSARNAASPRRGFRVNEHGRTRPVDEGDDTRRI